MIKHTSPRCHLIWIMLVLLDCRPVKPITVVSRRPEALQVKIIARNISEDFSGKDELIILGYVHNDSVLNKPIFAQKYYFGKNAESKQFDCIPYVSIENKSLLIFLLEEDDDTPIEDLDSVIRINHDEIRSAFASRDYTGLEKYIGNDDVLGIKHIPAINCESSTMIRVSGIYKVDRYDYSVEIGCK